MEQPSPLRYIPDHPVPVPLSKVASATKERIEWGKVELVRVQVMGIVESIELNESDMDFVLVDESGENKVTVQKILTSSFPRELASQLSVGHLVEVYGKIRLSDDNAPFLNALAIHVVTEPQFAAFQTLCRISKMYYTDNLPVLPTSTTTNAPAKLGLKPKVGVLNRFPAELLEESSSTENNMGEWPIEIEYLAAGIEFNKNEKREDSSDDDDEEEKDVFENDDKMEEEEEDSFDAGPAKAGTIQQEMDTDSFENGAPQKTGTQEGNMEVETDSFDDAVAKPVKAQEVVEEIVDSFEAGPPKPQEQAMSQEPIEYDSFEDI